MFHSSILWRSSRQEIKRELFQWCKSIRLDRIVPGFFSYYSAWNFMILLLSKHMMMPDLISYVPWLVAVQCFVGGYYVTHIYPRRIVISYMNMCLDYDIFLIMMDILSHQLPLLYVSRPRDRLDIIHWLPGNIPFLIYWSRFSVFDKYELDRFDILVCFLIYVSICILFA
jgi:hypothetical protein